MTNDHEKKERKVTHFDVHWCIKSGNSICYQVCSVHFFLNLSLPLVLLEKLKCAVRSKADDDTFMFCYYKAHAHCLRTCVLSI